MGNVCGGLLVLLHRRRNSKARLLSLLLVSSPLLCFMPTMIQLFLRPRQVHYKLCLTLPKMIYSNLELEIPDVQ